MAFMPASKEMSLAVGVSTDGVDKFNNEFESMKNSMLTFRRAVGLTGAALTALSTVTLSRSIDAAREFEQSVATIEKVANADIASGMRDQIQGMAQDIPITQSALADLSADAARFGLESEENIANFVETSAQMGAATTVSVEDAAEAFARLTTLTDTAVEDVDRLGSSINILSNSFATTADEIVDSMLRSGAAMNDFGLNQREIAAVSAALNEVSESSRRAGSRLRRLTQELTDPRKLQSIAMGFADIGMEKLTLGDNTEITTQRIQEETRELNRLETQLMETDQQMAELSDRQQNLGDDITENMIEIREMRLQAQKEGRELSDAEQDQIEDLELANEELRLEQMKVNQEIDEQRREREDLSDEIGEQEQAVSNAEDAFVDEFRAIVDEAPMEALEEFAEMVREGDEAADIFTENLSTTSRQALSGIAANLDGVNEAIEMSNEEFDEASSLQREMAIETGTTNSQLQLLRNNIRQQGIEIGDELLPQITTVVEALNDWMTSSDGLLQSLTAQQKLIGVLSGLVLGLGGVIFWFLGGPIAALAVAIGAVFVAFSQNMFGIRDVTMRALQATDEIFGDTIDDIIGATRFLFDVLVGAAENGLELFRQFWESQGDNIMGTVRNIFATIARIVETSAERIVEVFGPMIERLAIFWEDNGEEIISTTARIFSVISAIIFGAIDAILWVINGTLSLIDAAFDSVIGQAIVTTVQYAFDVIMTVIEISLTSLLSTINILLDVLSGDFESAFDEYKEMWSDVFDAIVGFAERWGFIEAITDAIDTVKTKFSDFKDWLFDLFDGLGEGVGDSLRSGINMATGLPFNESIGPITAAGETILPETGIEIPALAEGGIVTAPTMAMVGEAGDEAVMPLDKLEQLGGTSEVTVRFEGDGRIVDLIRSEAEVIVEDRDRSQHFEARSQ